MQYRPHRYLTDYSVTLQTPEGRRNANVRDVSNGGARLTGLTGLERGDKVRLDVLSNFVDAVVLWSKGDHVGISFRPAISDRFLDTLRKRVDSRGHYGAHRFGGYPEMR